MILSKNYTNNTSFLYYTSKIKFEGNISIIVRKLFDTLCKWALSWENLSYAMCANNNGTDQPAHLHSLIGAFVVRCLDSVTMKVHIPEISRLSLPYTAEQAGLSLIWSWTPEERFSDSMPYHEIMELFVLQKHIPQTYMRSHPVGLSDFWSDPLSTSILHVCKQRRLW